MQYVAFLLIGVFAKVSGLSGGDDLAMAAGALFTAYLLFFDGARARCSVIVKYHRLSIVMSAIALVSYLLLWYVTLPHETARSLGAMLLIMGYDTRALGKFMENPLIPDRIRQSLYIDGLLRTLLAAVAVGFSFERELLSLFSAVLLGVIMGGIATGIAKFIRDHTLFFLLPIVAYCIGVKLAGEGVLPTLICGCFMGNVARSSFRGAFAKVKKLNSRIYPLLLFLFGYIYGAQYRVIFNVEFFLILFFFTVIMHSVVVVLSYMFVKMQWQTYVLASLVNMPGALLLGLSIIAYPPTQPFIPALIGVSVIIHGLFFSRIAAWYGSIFTGQDICSKLEEHKMTVNLV